MRTFVPIITLLCAAVAGAQPAPPAAPTAVPGATHEVRDAASGQTTTCACRTSGQGSMVCDQCTPETAEPPQLTVRVTKRGDRLETLPFWVDVTERLRGNPQVRTSVADLEIRVDDDSGIELAITCRATPEDRVYVPVSARVHHRPDELANRVGWNAARVCTRRPTRAEPTMGTTWAGCPLEDDHDRAGLQRSANRKIAISAIVPSHRYEWAKLREALVFDDLIYHCARELHVDPVGASGTGNKATFRANATLVCANDPQRRGEFNAGEAGMDVETFRRHVGTELRRICGISATTTTSRSAQ